MMALRGPVGACRLPAFRRGRAPRSRRPARGRSSRAARSARAGSRPWHRWRAPPPARCWSRGRCADSPLARAKRSHSSTRRAPMPRPRAAGSTSSRRSCAVPSTTAPLASSRAWTRKTQPTLTPSRSAIQQASRAASKRSTKSAAMRATSASKRMSQPYSLGVERAVALDDPADVARLRRPHQPGRGGALALAEERLDLGHRAQQALLLAFGQGGEQGGDVGLALAVERREGASAGGAEAEVEVARVARRALAADQLLRPSGRAAAGSGSRGRGRGRAPARRRWCGRGGRAPRAGATRSARSGCRRASRAGRRCAACRSG